MDAARFLSDLPWRRRGIVVTASAYRTEDPGFEPRQGARILGLYTYIAVLLSKLNIHCHCVCWREKNALHKWFCTTSASIVRTGVDVMITIFLRFFTLFGEKKLAFFTKKQML
jgi:hypothetical protein